MTAASIQLVTPTLNLASGRLTFSRQALAVRTFLLPNIEGPTFAGQTLSVPGGYPSYQWYVDGVAVPGATTRTFGLTAGHVGGMISVSVGFDELTPPVGPVMPAFFADADGVWNTAHYSASPRPHVPNAASSTAFPGNMLTAERHMFSKAAFFDVLGTPTIVDNSVSGPGGATDAAVLTGGAEDWALYRIIDPLPAGDWTMVVVARSNTGSPQNFRMGAFPNPFVTKTAGTTYARHTVTFNVAAPGLVALNFLRAVSSAAGSFRIHEVALYPGSADLGAHTLAGHMVFGADAFTDPPNVDEGFLSIPAGNNPKLGLAQFESFTALTGFTVVALGKRLVAPLGTNIYQTALSSADGYNRLTATMAGGPPQDGPLLAFGSTSGTIGAGDIISGHKPGLWNYTDDQVVCIGSRYDGTKGTIWRGDIRAVEGAAVGATAQVRDLVLGSILGGQTASYAFAAIAYWPRALSDDEMRSAYSFFKTTASASGIDVSEQDFICAEGDSITQGFGTTTSYALIFGGNSSPAVDGVVVARPSATLLAAYDIETGNSLEARATYVDAMIPPDKNGRRFILSVLTGNDFVNGYASAAAYAAEVADYAAARRSAGWDKIVLCTMLPRTAAIAPGFNALRNAFNAIVTAPGWATANGFDAIADLAGVAGMGADADAVNATNYPDGVHPSAAGHALLEPVYRATINGL